MGNSPISRASTDYDEYYGEWVGSAADYEKMEEELDEELELLRLNADVPVTVLTRSVRTRSAPTRSAPAPTRSAPTSVFNGDVHSSMLQCYCNIEPVRKTSFSTINISRRYYGCRNITPTGNCGFVYWIDEPLTNRGVEFAMELLEENNRLRFELDLRDSSRLNRPSVNRY